MIRRFLMLLPLLSQALLAAPVEIPLWPDGEVPAPAIKTTGPESVTEKDGIVRRFNITVPRMEVFPAAEGKRSGAGCVVVPGGGFRLLAEDHEGRHVCQWLAERGVTAFLLRHRCPTDGLTVPNVPAVQDAQRALTIVKQRAAEWQVDAAKVGLFGCSAGGQAALVAATNESYVAMPAGSPSHRPAFLVLVYPWKVYDDAAQSVRLDVRLDQLTPPLFIAQAADDKSCPVEGVVRLYLAAVEAQSKAALIGVVQPKPELHLYHQGGHGVGMLKSPTGAVFPENWAHRMGDWLVQLNFMKP